MNYEQYLQSLEWRSLRQQVLERDQHQCQTCLEKESLEVHHKTYERLGQEPLDDLITLCSECHEAITCVIRRRRYQARAIVVETVQRTTPLIIIEANNAANIEIQTHIRITPARTQRTTRRPARQIYKDAETSEQQTRQDGHRPRRDVED